MSLAHHIVVYRDNEGVSGCSLQTLLYSLNSNSNSKERSSASASASASAAINIDPTNNVPKTKICVVGCCNGLVLCLKYSYPVRSFILRNPAIGVFMELPKLDSIDHKYGFGWDESSGAFKVFTTSIVTNDDYDGKMSISGQVYSSKTNSWKTVCSGRLYYLSNEMGVVVCGRIHWHMKQRLMFDGFIESFNLEDDEFGRIEPPPPSNAIADLATGGRGRPETWLGEIWGCLCGLLEYHDTSLDFWVMKEYGVKESWYKLLTFHLDFVYEPSRSPPLCGEGLNGDIFLIFRDKLMVYSPNKDDHNLQKIANFGKSYAAHVYVESLISPLKNEYHEKKKRIEDVVS